MAHEIPEIKRTVPAWHGVQNGVEMTAGHKAGWSRLQRVSLYHAAKLYSESVHAKNPRHVSVPEVIKENVEILGKGTEEEVKARIHWYITFYPEIFSGS
jgi:hypothetical protein